MYEFSLVTYYAVQVLAIIPPVVGLATLAVGLFRRSWSGATASILLGMLVTGGWALAWALGMLASRPVWPSTLEIDSTQMSLIIVTGYGPYFVIGLLYAMAPVTLGELVLRRTPATFSAAAQRTDAMRIWVRGTRFAGVYLAAYAVLGALLNSDLLILFMGGLGV